MLLDRYILTGFSHLLCTGLVWKILLFILPWKITSWFWCAGEVIMIALVAKITFGFSKKYFLGEEITDLEKKAVLITGCDHGFGNELAKRMHSKGFHVFACCLNDKSEGAKALENQYDRIKVLKMDVTQPEDIKKAEDEVKKHLENKKLELWAVVNNAGVFKGISIEFTAVETFEENMKVNTFGMLRVTKTFLPHVKKCKGRVVNVASLAGRVPSGHIAPYTMSKFAAVAFTECLRQEMLPFGVKVISIEPEFFKTPMADKNNFGKLIDETFGSIDAAVRKDYGDEYFKALKSHLLLGPTISSPKIYKVMEALEKSICLMYPDTVYKPCRNVLFSALFFVWKITPCLIQDIVNALFRRIKVAIPTVECHDHES